MNDQIQIERAADHDNRTIRVKRGLIRFTDRQLRNFWKKVNKQDGENACWIWTAARDGMAYGSFGVATKLTSRAHRVSYQIKHGPIPTDICVLHDCPDGDNPACVNPDHLWLGTRVENNEDCIAKGRARHPSFKKRPEDCVRGERINTAKLKVEQVIAIREEYETGNVRQVDLAAKYGVTQTAISFIIRRRNWRLL